MLIYLQKCGSFTQISFCRKIQQKAKISAETRRDQLTSRIKVATKNRSRDRKLSCQSIPSHNITKFNLKEEIEVLKMVKSLLEERS